MTRQKFVEQYLTPSNAPTTATRRATAQDKRAALPEGRVDYRVDNATSHTTGCTFPRKPQAVDQRCS